MRLSEAAARITSELSSAGLSLTRPELRGECAESLGEIDGRPFAAYFFPGKFSDTIIIKIERTIKSCYEALLSPTGLYYIVDPNTGVDPSRFKRKVLLVLLAQED